MFDSSTATWGSPVDLATPVNAVACVSASACISATDGGVRLSPTTSDVTLGSVTVSPGSSSPTVAWQSPTVVPGSVTVTASSPGNPTVAAIASGPATSVVLPGLVAGVSYSLSLQYSWGFGILLEEGPSVVGGTLPAITKQPTGGTIAWGATTKLAVKATGSPTPTVQWQSSDDHVSFTNIPRATSTTLSVAGDLAHWPTKWYRAVVTNGVEAVTSSAVSVTVNASAPVITKQPVSVSQKVGKKVSLKVKAVGTPTPTYQWMKYQNGAWISVVGRVASTLTLKPASIATDRYRVVISNPIGSVTSSSVDVTTTP